MKRPLFYLLTIVLLFPACSSTFYYSTLNTTNDYVEKVDNGDFLLETDSLWIAYCFKGAYAPVQITIFNKTNKPLCVDWRRSALIIGNTPINYAGEKMNFPGDWESYDNSDRTDSQGSSDGRTALPGGVSFVPPQTMISEIPLRLNPRFDNINKKEYRNSYLSNVRGKEIKTKRIEFDPANSPLTFKSYLTVYYQPDKPMTYEQDFYMDSLFKTSKIAPYSLSGQMADRGDFFYVEKLSKNYIFLSAVGSGVASGLVVLLELSLNIF
ncbi:MAG: hypothetical protein LBN74_06825 [Prevotella sp.]|jgi:hypothetical protein|nr:hypothetical protein [Prevotella sp.]